MGVIEEEGGGSAEGVRTYCPKERRHCVGMAVGEKFNFYDDDNNSCDDGRSYDDVNGYCYFDCYGICNGN